MAVEDARVVDADLLDLAAQVVFPLLDEGLGHRADVLDAAVEPERGVDTVRQQIAGDSGACDLHVKPPEARATLREIGTNGPILQEVRAVMENLPQLAPIDDVLGEDDGGAAAVIIPNHV